MIIDKNGANTGLTYVLVPDVYAVCGVGCVINQRIDGPQQQLTLARTYR